MENMKLMFSQKYVVILTITLSLLSGLGGYFMGKKESLSESSISPIVSPTTSITPILAVPSKIIINPTLAEENTSWGIFSQEYLPNYIFQISYPLDNKHEPYVYFPKDSGWPISILERLFISHVEFGNYIVGISEVDPTTCYTDTCKDTIDSIIREESVVVDKIPSRKITAPISQKGGGITMPGKQPESILYIIPYQNRYVILLSYYPDSGFEKFVSSFKIKDNQTGNN